jgi:predicted GTPase
MTSCDFEFYPTQIQIKKLNILLFGPPGAGKSSFLRTLDSCFQGRLSSIVDAGTATSSLTRELRKITLGIVEALLTLSGTAVEGS